MQQLWGGFSKTHRKFYKFTPLATGELNPLPQYIKILMSLHGRSLGLNSLTSRNLLRVCNHSRYSLAQV